MAGRAAADFFSPFLFFFWGGGGFGRKILSIFGKNIFFAKMKKEVSSRTFLDCCMLNQCTRRADWVSNSAPCVCTKSMLDFKHRCISLLWECTESWFPTMHRAYSDSGHP